MGKKGRSKEDVSLEYLGGGIPLQDIGLQSTNEYAELSDDEKRKIAKDYERNVPDLRWDDDSDPHKTHWEKEHTPESRKRDLMIQAGNLRKQTGDYLPALRDYRSALSHDDRADNLEKFNARNRKTLEKRVQLLEKVLSKKVGSVTRFFYSIPKETRIAAVVLSFIVSLFFFSSNITGNAIGNLAQTTFNIIGAVLFILGLIGVFFLTNK
ncbi:hypothetical protein J4225_00280 [Candidatus Pacearchaeota archaeon]|nr:hypothetical protein [Candidatus Pacearchaeota archaeon]